MKQRENTDSEKRCFILLLLSFSLFILKFLNFSRHMRSWIFVGTSKALGTSGARFVSNYCGAAAVLIFGCSACGLIKERPADKPSGLDVVGKPMTSEQAKEVLGTVGGNFAYGSGLGDAALNIGTAVVFPPYAFYLLSNAVLSVSGYEPITISSLLPEEDGKQWSRTYDKVVSGPGRVVAAVAGHEYRSQEVADERLSAVLQKIKDTAEADAVESKESKQ
jgi:hypothetical protein